MNHSRQKKIKVLVVDDSRVVAELLTHLLRSDDGIEVVGVARNGEEAIEAVLRTKPDVITMDIHMPKMDGYEATRRIMETCPTPVVIVSGSSTPNEVANNFRAIEAGALAVAERPAINGRAAAELINTVKLMSDVKVIRRWPRSKYSPSAPSASPRTPFGKMAGPVRIVAIGASTGGPLVLKTILSALTRDFPLPVLIVQHMANGFVHGFVEWLAQASNFPVKVAENGESLEPGKAYVAPDDFHIGAASGNRVLLSKDEPENGMRPSVSFLFRSVEKVYGAMAAGVLLTGMGKDGVDELKVLKDAGAVTLAQDKETSVIFGMPGQAVEIDAATWVLPPEGIAKTLLNIVTKP